LRIPTYISYSSLAQYEKDREEFYRKYLASNRPPRIPQDRPASVGSAFDAYAKSSLHAALYGDGADPEYGFEALFEKQVEAQNRDWAREHGAYVFECYKVAGQYDTLLGLLQESPEPPRFEFEVKADIGGVPFLGKPDCRYKTKGGIPVIHDFKVNGYCSKSATSPTKGYMLCTDGFKATKQNKSHGTAHKLFAPVDLNGYTIDAGYLEDYSTGWADQLSLYGWGLGEKIGDENLVVAIDQIVAKPLPDGNPQLRVASFRARVRDSYQAFLLKRLQQCWETILSGHIFPELTKEENDTRIGLLDASTVALQGHGDDMDKFIGEVVRPKFRG
jgi:hypothetical protein